MNRPRVAKKAAQGAEVRDRALELLRLLFDRDCAVYAHEITVPMRSHADACAALRSVRELLARAEGKV